MKNSSKDIKIIEALKRLTNPIEDKKHNLLIYFNDNRARSNESRFEHVASRKHRLNVKDIKYIPQGICKAKLIKEKNRKNTFNYYFKRKGSYNEFIKISIMIDRKNNHIGYVKTMFVTKSTK